MTLITSISGIRGTIGGKPNESLSPIDIVKYTSAFSSLLKSQYPNQILQVVVGRDARISGKMVSNLCISVLNSFGINVIDAELATTPTVAMGVMFTCSHGGIILTASHNPEHWNALKLLNKYGEFISNEEGEQIIQFALQGEFQYASVNRLGWYKKNNQLLAQHVKAIIDLPLVKKQAIEKKKFKVVVDGINSIGAFAVPYLLKNLGVKVIKNLNADMTGKFAHNPEPLPEHLKEVSQAVLDYRVDLAFVVDPDVDRLAIINEDGTMFGEEYTLVSVADYILKNTKGNTVSNLSSSIALKKITKMHTDSNYFPSAVGEVNVVKKMKEVKAVIGGEGNGGIIYPELHYGRDALVGIALFLSYLATSKFTKCSELKKSYPHYEMFKHKISLPLDIQLDEVLEKLKLSFSTYLYDETDGLKIYFENDTWVHIRKSNTEPIFRIYSEARSLEKAKSLINRVEMQINLFLKE